jgi:hypothetical protein
MDHDKIHKNILLNPKKTLHLLRKIAGYQRKQ